MKFRTLFAAVAAGVVLSGCAAGQAAVPASTGAGAKVTTPAQVPLDQMLTTHQLTGLTARQIVDKLDAAEDDRSHGPIVSVRPREMVLTDSTGQASMPMPSDAFYLSIAPYVNKTHECFNHNLGTCKGELADKTVHVVVSDASGNKLVDSDVKTYSNGFAGLWLPRNIKGTVTVVYDGKSATTTFGTTDADPTCLTTLKLT